MPAHSPAENKASYRATKLDVYGYSNKEKTWFLDNTVVTYEAETQTQKKNRSPQELPKFQSERRGKLGKNKTRRVLPVQPKIKEEFKQGDYKFANPKEVCQKPKNNGGKGSVGGWKRIRGGGSTQPGKGGSTSGKGGGPAPPRKGGAPPPPSKGGAAGKGQTAGGKGMPPPVPDKGPGKGPAVPVKGAGKGPPAPVKGAAPHKGGPHPTKKAQKGLLVSAKGAKGVSGGGKGGSPVSTKGGASSSGEKGATPAKDSAGKGAGGKSSSSGSREEGSHQRPQGRGAGAPLSPNNCDAPAQQPSTSSSANPEGSNCGGANPDTAPKNSPDHPHHDDPPARTKVPSTLNPALHIGREDELRPQNLQPKRKGRLSYGSKGDPDKKDASVTSKNGFISGLPAEIERKMVPDALVKDPVVPGVCDGSFPIDPSKQQAKICARDRLSMEFRRREKALKTQPPDY